MESFSVRNTTVAKSLVFPVVGAMFTPILTSPNTPGDVQLTNFAVVSAYYKQVGHVVSVSLKFTVHVEAVGLETNATVIIPPPVYHVVPSSGVGLALTLDKPGFFGTMGTLGTNLVGNLLNVSGPFSGNVELEILGMYNMK